MSIISRMRRQKAVWWQRLTPDQYGKFSYASPVEIDCRWDGCGKEFRNEMAEVQMSAATVYPDRVMAQGDMLQEGELEFETPIDPTGVITAHAIIKFETTPNLRNAETLYTALLS